MDHPEVVVIDVDGVLTDGTLTIDHDGRKMFKKFHTRDVRAIRELVANGIEVYLVTADDWAGTKHFADKVGAQFIYLRDKSMLFPQLRERHWWAVGDDAWDVDLLLAADCAFCPKDADNSVLRIERVHKLDKRGGEGVIAELITWFLTCASS